MDNRKLYEKKEMIKKTKSPRWTNVQNVQTSM